MGRNAGVVCAYQNLHQLRRLTDLGTQPLLLTSFSRWISEAVPKELLDLRTRLMVLEYLFNSYLAELPAARLEKPKCTFNISSGWQTLSHVEHRKHLLDPPHYDGTYLQVAAHKPKI